MNHAVVVESLMVTEAVVNVIWCRLRRDQGLIPMIRRQTSRGRTSAMWKSKYRYAMPGRSSVK